MRNNILTLVLLCCCNCTLSAQELLFKSYTSGQGLSQNSGYCITQDALGYIWMGTQDGLNKFNGRHIVTYYQENVTRGKLPNNFINSISYDSTQNWHWVGTAGGLCIYNILADSFYSASSYFPSGKMLDSLAPRSLARISNMEMAVITVHDGIFICNSQTKTVKQYFQKPASKDHSTAVAVWGNKIVAAVNGQLYEIKENPVALLENAVLGDVRKMIGWKNELWIASTTNGLFHLNDSVVLKAVGFNCGSKDIGPLAVDDENQLWIGTRNKGLIIISPSTLQPVYTYENATNQDVWPLRFTLSLFKDRQGIMWTGSSGGGFTACNKKSTSFGLIRKREVLSGKAAHNMILSISAINDNCIFLGTQLEGIRSYNPKTREMISYENNTTTGANSIYNICNTGPNNTWLATAAGLYHFNNGTKKFTAYNDDKFVVSSGGQYVYKLKHADSLIYCSAKGTLFFDLLNKKFQPFGNDERMKKLVLYKAVESELGRIWLGCLDKGLVQFDLHTQQFTIIDTILKFSKFVYAVFPVGDLLWLGTGNGLLIFDTKKNKLVKVLSLGNGLPGNVIYSIERDLQGNIWCSSNVGLIRVDPKTYAILHVSVSAGLQSGEFNTDCSLKDVNGNLYFGGINGVSYFNPAKFSVPVYSPAALIESFKVFNKELSLPKHIAYTKSIGLPDDQNFITLEFGVPNYDDNEGCIFRYQLTGVDKDWVYAGNRTYANNTNLKPGKYSFRLQSANSSGMWSAEVTTLELEIYPAWWQIWWVQLTAILLFAAGIALLVRRRINTIHEMAAVKEEISKTEMAALKAQMNPHFMFNCINSIDAFIHSNDKYNATLYLNKFAKLLRNILDNSKHNLVTLAKDVETLKLYIQLEELRHENKFQTSINIEEELFSNDYKVPPLIIQPFVENAILHGLKNREGNEGKLQIDIKKEGEKILFSITDNGIGRVAAAKIIQTKESSYGMQMSYDRIKLFNNEKTASVEINDLYENGLAKGTQINVYLIPS